MGQTSEKSIRASQLVPVETDNADGFLCNASLEGLAVHMAPGDTGGCCIYFLLPRSEGHHHTHKGHSCGASQTGVFCGNVTLVTLVSPKVLSIQDVATF